MFKRLLFLLAVTIFLPNCAFFEKTEPLAVAKVRFENASYYPVTNIRLKVDSIKGVVSCPEIRVTKDCYTDFPGQKYAGNSITISWEQNGKSWTTGEISAEMPKVVKRNVPLTCSVIIGNQGSYNTHFTQ
jgi:hypothetical protein